MDKATAEPQKPLKALGNRIRPFLLVGVVVFVIAEIVALSPKPLEQRAADVSVDPEELIENSSVLATGIPKNRIPDYSVDQFNYVSTQGERKQWKLLADQAYLYNQERIVHAINVTAFLFDANDKVTLVTGKEAKYFMNQKDLEIFGDVVSKFPDGFETHSEYLRYQPDRRKIEIPTKYQVFGKGSPSENGQPLAFQSMGMFFAMDSSRIILPQAVEVTMIKKDTKSSEHAGVPEKTVISSDHCVIDRQKQTAEFTMNPKRKLETRFVHIDQPNGETICRHATLNYGDYEEFLQYLIAYEDVLIKETSNEDSMRYATGGRADFDAHRNVIVLKEFPQVYQDNDTVTGDIIIVHRDTDVVEVEHSNAFSEGKRQ